MCHTSSKTKLDDEIGRYTTDRSNACQSALLHDQQEIQLWYVCVCQRCQCVRMHFFLLRKPEGQTQQCLRIVSDTAELSYAATKSNLCLIPRDGLPWAQKSRFPLTRIHRFSFQTWRRFKLIALHASHTPRDSAVLISVLSRLFTP